MNFNKREVAVRRLAISVAGSAMAVGIALSSSVFAQGRTIEETLVVSDPTVAASGKWKVGGALEYWWVRTNYDLVDSSGNKVGDSTLTFKQPGFNLFAAYGNLTVQATRRSGEGDYTAIAGTLQYSGPQESTDEEITLRYLFPTRSVSPYVLLGYAKTELTQTFNLNSPPASVWSCSGTRTMQQKTEYKGPLFGGGAIFPFSEKFGARTDLRLKYNSGSSKTGNCAERTGNGFGYDFTATGYYNITQGWNLQAGAKMQWLNAGEDVPQWFRIGLFGMVGYSYRF